MASSASGLIGSVCPRSWSQRSQLGQPGVFTHVLPAPPLPGCPGPSWLWVLGPRPASLLKDKGVYQGRQPELETGRTVLTMIPSI